MAEGRIRILSTRPLDEEPIDIPAQVQLDQVSMIGIRLLEDEKTHQQVSDALARDSVVVFTSMNAVEAVASLAKSSRPAGSIFCIGYRTMKLIESSFGRESIAGTASSAADLARLILDRDVKGPVIFFCGNQRREELPQILRSGGMELDEITVYESRELPQRVDINYHAILFFSPSAVHAFFRINQTGPGTVMFVIGETTAAAVRQYGDYPIVVSPEPVKRNLTEAAIRYFCAGGASQ